VYRPKKRKLVRRVSAASVVAVVAAVGLGITFVNQSGAANSAHKVTTEKADTTVAATSAATTAKYHVVSTTSSDD
jgi:anti-sigma-K factor RskA